MNTQCEGKGPVFNVCTYMEQQRWLCVCEYCHVCSCSPSLAFEGARLPFITHTCRHHYAQQCSLDSPGPLPFVDCPVYNCLLPHLFPVSALMSLFCPLSRRCSCLVYCPLFIKCSPCTCFLSPASILTYPHTHTPRFS